MRHGRSRLCTESDPGLAGAVIVIKDTKRLAWGPYVELGQCSCGPEDGPRGIRGAPCPAAQ